MSDELAKRAKQRMVGNYLDWIKDFDVSEYEDNPPLIEKLYEEKQLALAVSIDHEERISNLSDQVHRLELENKSLEGQLEAVQEQSLTAFVLSLIAAISVGIGTNIATDKPYKWVGWVMIVFSAVLELVVYMNLRQRRG